MTKRYHVAQLRAQLARALDEVERGETVVIERRGRRFLLTAQEPNAPWPARPKPQVEIRDPALLDGQWGWEDGGPGRPPTFVARDLETSPAVGEPPPAPSRPRSTGRAGKRPAAKAPRR